MSVHTQLTRLLNAKQSIKNAIESKGIFVGKYLKLEEYPALIKQIATEQIDNTYVILKSLIDDRDVMLCYPGTADIIILPIKNISISTHSAFVTTTSPPLDLNVSIFPENTNQKITWRSSNENVALVHDGVVMPVSSGTTIITASAGYIHVNCAVTVT